MALVCLAGGEGRKGTSLPLSRGDLHASNEVRTGIQRSFLGSYLISRMVSRDLTRVRDSSTYVRIIWSRQGPTVTRRTHTNHWGIERMGSVQLLSGQCPQKRQSLFVPPTEQQWRHGKTGVFPSIIARRSCQQTHGNLNPPGGKEPQNVISSYEESAKRRGLVLRIIFAGARYNEQGTFRAERWPSYPRLIGVNGTGLPAIFKLSDSSIPLPISLPRETL